jgi:ABC-2 type transport system ATP-binding protein
MLSARGISKWFGSHCVLDHVGLDVRHGERVVIVGENGCGKSTLLQIVAGVLETYEGKMTLPPSLGYAPEKPDMPDHLLAGEWLDIVASLKRARWRDNLVDGFAVDPLLGRRIGALSLGQRQRISLVAAFTGAPPLLVLDEPTNALDDATRAALVARLRSATALIATHDSDFAASIGTRIVSIGEISGEDAATSSRVAFERVVRRC